MMYINNINWDALSDTAIAESLGAFIRHHRLDQNKSQSSLAEEAGINRSTLVAFEKGANSSILTFIQLMRALHLLDMFDMFKIIRQPGPLQLAEMEQSYRKRAGKTKKKTKKYKSDW